MLLLVLLAVLGIVGMVGLVSVRVFLFEPYRIPAASMAPTLPIGAYIVVDKRFGEVARGDVLVFEYPQDRSIDYVKRVIGLPGEQIELRKQVVYIDGSPLESSFVEEATWTDSQCRGNQARLYEEGDGAQTWQVLRSTAGLSRLADFGPTQIPADRYFVLGDNRDNSADSRIWGTVPADHLVGRLSRQLFSFDSCGS